jgi:hypothetical protein
MYPVPHHCSATAAASGSATEETTPTASAEAKPAHSLHPLLQQLQGALLVFEIDNPVAIEIKDHLQFHVIDAAVSVGVEGAKKLGLINLAVAISVHPPQPVGNRAKSHKSAGLPHAESTCGPGCRSAGSANAPATARRSTKTTGATRSSGTGTESSGSANGAGPQNSRSAKGTGTQRPRSANGTGATARTACQPFGGFTAFADPFSHAGHFTSVKLPIAVFVELPQQDFLVGTARCRLGPFTGADTGNVRLAVSLRSGSDQTGQDGGSSDGTRSGHDSPPGSGGERPARRTTRNACTPRTSGDQPLLSRLDEISASCSPKFVATVARRWAGNSPRSGDRSYSQNTEVVFPAFLRREIRHHTLPAGECWTSVSDIPLP